MLIGSRLCTLFPSERGISFPGLEGFTLELDFQIFAVFPRFLELSSLSLFVSALIPSEK